MHIEKIDIQNAEVLLTIFEKGTFEIKGDSILLLSRVVQSQKELIRRMKVDEAPSLLCFTLEELEAEVLRRAPPTADVSPVKEERSNATLRGAKNKMKAAMSPLSRKKTV